VTPFGGLALLQRFGDQTGRREQLATPELPQGDLNRAYDPGHIIEGFWLGIWTGASRYIHYDWLRPDETLAAIFGYERLPRQSTYSRFFGKFSQARNPAVFPPLQRWFFEQINRGAVTGDFDSTEIPREGGQEGSAKDSNPNRKGRNSHHPLIALLSQPRMGANAWLRPGNLAACSNCVAFLRATYDEALVGPKVGLVRADSGFYTNALLSALAEAPPQLHHRGQGVCQPQERGLRSEGLGKNLSGHRRQRVAAPAGCPPGQSPASPRRAQGDQPPAAGCWEP
jgi:hypothetical protein